MSVIFENVDKIVNASGVGIDFAQGVGGGSSKEFVATGNISQGQTVGLKADGTVEVIQGTTTTQTENIGSTIRFKEQWCEDISAVFDSSQNKIVIAYRDHTDTSALKGGVVVGTVSGNNITFGTPIYFTNNQPNVTKITFDSNSNKIVIVYRDAGNSNYGTAIVGTVSGNNITFGNTSVFKTGFINDFSVCFDSNSNKVVIAFSDNNNSTFGEAVVGTVSGNSISFGSPVVFFSDVMVLPNIVFDSSNNKVIITYADYNNNYYGTAILGTVSGNSISFGSPVIYHSNRVEFINSAFDPNTNKIIIVYTDVNNSYYGTVVIGEVSGNSISFGSPVVFFSGYAHEKAVAVDPYVNRVVIVYRDDADAQKGKVITGTISGNSISLGSPVQFRNVAVHYLSTFYDSSQQKMIVVFMDYAQNLRYGAAYVHTTVGNNTITNASSWLGVADETINSGGSGKVNLNGSIDSHQTGLTAGNTYYVNYDGTLTDTPNEGAKNGTYGKIGKALSSTSLLLSK